MGKEVYLWLYLEKELVEITEEIKTVLNLKPFYSDYENVWEWCEAEERDGLYYNFSRTYNWETETGNYDYPVTMRFERENGIFHQHEIDEMASTISKFFNIKVHYGDVIYVKGD
ncbi:hypothetical protein, partial [Vallitalea sediminicola]